MRRRSRFVLETLAAAAADVPRGPAPSSYFIRELVHQLSRGMGVVAGLTTIMERGAGDALAQRAAATLADVAGALTAPLPDRRPERRRVCGATLRQRVVAVGGCVAALRALARGGAGSDDARRALLGLGCAHDGKEAEGPKPKRQRRR